MIQVIQRALDILEFVAKHGKEPVRLTDIAEKVNLGLPTTANIVKTLVEKHYLEQVGRKVGYRLGTAAYQLSVNPSFDQDIIRVSKNLLAELTSQVNETSFLAVIRNNKRVILQMEECNQALQVRTTQIAEVYPTSTGRILMAYMPPKELDKLISNLGFPAKSVWQGTQTRESLDAVLNEIREKGFVKVTSVLHTVAFGVPIYKNDEVIAGLGLYIPESRYTKTFEEKLLKSMFQTAKAITKLLKQG